MNPGLGLVDDADAAHAALSPLRRTILAELGQPASASEVAARLGLARQKVNYHLTVLARHGLVELAEERQRRGFVEKRYRRPDSLVLAPDLLHEPGAARDAASKDAVVAAASDAIRAVHSTADQPAPTATLVTDISFATPAAMQSFLADFAALAARYDRGDAGLPMRISLLAHPTTAAKEGASP